MCRAAWPPAVEDAHAPGHEVLAVGHVPVQQRQHAPSAGERAAFDLRVAGSGRAGLDDVAFHLGGVPPQRVYLGTEDEQYGTGLVQAETGTGCERGPGVTFGRVEVEPKQGRGGELQADNRTGTGRA